MKLIRTTLQLSVLLVSFQATYISGSASAGGQPDQKTLRLREKNEGFMLLSKPEENRVVKFRTRCYPDFLMPYDKKDGNFEEGDIYPREAKEGWRVEGIWKRFSPLKDLFPPHSQRNPFIQEQKRRLVTNLIVGTCGTATLIALGGLTDHEAIDDKLLERIEKSIETAICLRRYHCDPSRLPLNEYTDRLRSTLSETAQERSARYAREAAEAGKTLAQRYKQETPKERAQRFAGILLSLLTPSQSAEQAIAQAMAPVAAQAAASADEETSSSDSEGSCMARPAGAARSNSSTSSED